MKINWRVVVNGHVYHIRSHSAGGAAQKALAAQAVREREFEFDPHTNKRYRVTLRREP